MSSASGAEYRVSRTGVAAQQIRDLGAKAKSLGMLTEFTNAVKKAVENLQTKPLEWGEPKHRTKKANGWVCYGFAEPIYVTYAVYEDERAVLILNVQPLARSPLRFES